MQPVDTRARLRLKAIWALVGPFERLVGAEPLELAVRRADSSPERATNQPFWEALDLDWTRDGGHCCARGQGRPATDRSRSPAAGARRRGRRSIASPRCARGCSVLRTRRSRSSPSAGGADPRGSRQAARRRALRGDLRGCRTGTGAPDRCLPRRPDRHRRRPRRRALRLRRGALRVDAAPSDVLRELAATVAAELERGALAAELETSTVRLDLGFAAANIGSFDWDLVEQRAALGRAADGALRVHGGDVGPAHRLVRGPRCTPTTASASTARSRPRSIAAATTRPTTASSIRVARCAGSPPAAASSAAMTASPRGCSAPPTTRPHA